MQGKACKVFVPHRGGTERVYVGSKEYIGEWLYKDELPRIDRLHGSCSFTYSLPHLTAFSNNCLLPTLSLCSGVESVDGRMIYENDLLVYTDADSDFEVFVENYVVEFNEETLRFQLRALRNGAVEDFSIARECNYSGSIYSKQGYKKEAARWSRT